MKPHCGRLHPCKDRISDLPEPIRSKVISFLPMEEAIRTSVLSREWRCVTASLPNLEFDQCTFQEKGYDEDQFTKIVDRLLISRARVDVERFELTVEGDDYLELIIHINVWILFAVHNNVRDFHLAILSGCVKLPCCFFQQCSTLIELRMEGNLWLKVPADAVFPMLKRCRLVEISFEDDSLTKNLFDSCPSMVELTLEHCYLDFCQGTFTISSSSLKMLTLNILIWAQPIDIVINTTSLQKIEYGCTVPPTLCSGTLCSLLRANFASVELANHSDCGENLILYGLPNVVRLSLCYSYSEIMSRHPNSLERLASSSKLRHLELEISPTWRQVNMVLTLLKIYNQLVTLHISFQINADSTIVSDDQQISDRFMLENLNKVKLADFQGSKEEMHIVRYLLENAIVLEKMTIKYMDDQKNNATTRIKVSEELVNVMKASTRATILFK